MSANVNQSAFKKPDSFHQERAKGIGGSEVAAILGISPYTTAHQLWLEKTGKVPPKDISNLIHVQRGVLGEEVCRSLLEREHLRSYKPKTWQGLKPWHRCSDDGWNIDTNTLLEIKCMGALNHAITGDKALPNKERVPPHYWCQVQWNLFVSKADKCLFISYRPEDETMHIVEVLPDPAEQKKIEEAVDYFWLNNVQQDIPPALTEKDYVLVGDKTLDEKLKKYEDAQKLLKAMQEEIDVIKEDLRSHLTGHPAVKTGSGFKLSITHRQGGVDYARLCKDKAITEEELKAYRKKPTEVFTIRSPSSSASQ